MTNPYRSAPDDISARDMMLLQALRRGDCFFELLPVRLGRLTVYMMADSFRWGAEDGPRLAMSAAAQAEALEALELLHHTAATADAAAAAAIADGGLVGPFVRGDLDIGSDSESMSTAAMVRHSDRIDLELGDNFAGMCSAWKRRIIARALWSAHGMQCAYGWWLEAPGLGAPAPVHAAMTDRDLVVIQVPLLGHSAFTFGDYSEFPDGLSWHGELDGEDVDLRDVMTGVHGTEAALELCPDGVLPGWRPPYAAPAGELPASTPPAPDSGPVVVDMAAPPARLLRLTAPMMRGADVEELQRAIGVEADGVFGPVTEAAVRRVQRGAGLEDDGIVGPQTRRALAELAAADTDPAQVDPATDAEPLDNSAGSSSTIRLGVDVSHHQKLADTDWPSIAAAGQSFAICRATYGTRPDGTFVRHFAAATSAGMIGGAYHFYRQTQRWHVQLSKFVEMLETVGYGAGCLAPAIDLEWNEKNADGTVRDGPVDPAIFNSDGRELCEAVRDHFGGAMLYLSPGFFDTLGRPAWMLEYPWWIAHLTSKAEPWCPFKEWAIWQYSGSGSVAGYSGAVIDLNRARDLPTL